MANGHCARAACVSFCFNFAHVMFQMFHLFQCFNFWRTTSVTERACVCVCVCVCVSVCPRSANAIKRLYSILNLPMDFLLSVEDFQLTDLSKRPSFRRYSLFRSF